MKSPLSISGKTTVEQLNNQAKETRNPPRTKKRDILTRMGSYTEQATHSWVGENTP